MTDPFAIPPTLWFGLLCNAAGSDPDGRLSFREVFNQVAFFTPPAESGVAPHGFLNGVLALGLSGGVGHFEATIELRDVDDRTLWQRPEGRWAFDLGPGYPSAVLVEQVRYWFKQPGGYHFWIHLPEADQSYVIRFEVARQIGPASLEQADPPLTG
jgi:hypothetical protein